MAEFQAWFTLRVDPSSEALVRKVGQAIEAQEIDAVLDLIVARMFTNGAGIEATGWPRTTVSLTAWAELTLREVYALASRPAWSPAMRVRAIDDALTFAGFPSKGPQ